MTRRAPALLAGATCLAWLALTTGYGAAAAASGVVLGGEPLPETASTDAANPTALAPGLWQATLKPTFPQYFSYQRRINGSRVHIGVMGAPQGDSGDGIRVLASVATQGSSDPTTCADESDSAESNIPQAVIGARVVVGDDSSTGETCRDAGTVQIEVNRGYGSATTDLPYVIKVVEEAPSSGTGDADAEDAPSYDVPEPGESRDLEGAASFADAPELDTQDGPATVRTTITEGTEQLWRVPLTWGDLPVVRVDVAAAKGKDEEAFQYSGPDLTLHLVDPLRGRLRYADSAAEDSPTGAYLAEADDREPTVLVASGYPVREVDDRLPGDYWVSLAVSPLPEPTDRTAVAVPVTVTVEVSHDEGAAPTYDGVVVSQDKKTSLEGYSPQRPFLVGEDTFAAVASGSPIGGDGWFSARHWAGLGLAAASVACLGAGVVRLRARR